MKLLITGGAGKVGRNFLESVRAEPRLRDAEIVALCNNRTVDHADGLRIARGSLADRATIDGAMAGVTHVLHMAAVKESPDLVIDVAIKGMFLLLEAFRISPDARQFILISGDCAVGHIFHGYAAPITEESPRRAYPGCYALTKILEEVMLEQYQIQYGLNGCILRAPWLMEKDDFRFALAFGPNQFGGPNWSDLIPKDQLSSYAAGGYVPILHDHEGAPLKRNFLHVDDLVRAILSTIDNPAAHQQLFNISMTDPVDYAEVARIVSARFGLKPVAIDTPFHSNFLDNAKARQHLGWAPEVGLEDLIDRAWRYERGGQEPRRIWYPG